MKKLKSKKLLAAAILSGVIIGGHVSVPAQANELSLEQEFQLKTAQDLPRQILRELEFTTSQLEKKLSYVQMIVRSHIRGNERRIPLKKQIAVQNLEQLVKAVKQLDRALDSRRSIELPMLRQMKQKISRAQRDFLPTAIDLPAQRVLRDDLIQIKNLLIELQKIGFAPAKRKLLVASQKIVFEAKQAIQILRSRYGHMRPHPRQGRRVPVRRARPVRAVQEVQDVLMEAQKLVNLIQSNPRALRALSLQVSKLEHEFFDVKLGHGPYTQVRGQIHTIAIQLKSISQMLP